MVISSLDISIYLNVIKHGGLWHVWVVPGIDLTFYEGCGCSNGLHPEGCSHFRFFNKPKWMNEFLFVFFIITTTDQS